MFERYRALLAKADAKFAEVRGRHAAAFHCDKGCHGCCLPGLSVSPLEAAHIRDYLAAHPVEAEKAIAVEAANPHEGARCLFLDAQGGCSIYPVRPLICRTHGMPVKFKNENDFQQRDVCPLNFTEEGIDSLPDEDVLNLDTLNTILALLNEHAAPGIDAERVPLTPFHMLPDKG